MGFQRNLDVVEAALFQRFHIGGILQAPAVGQQSRDEPQFLGVLDEIRQVLAQGGLAAREGHMRNPRVPDLFQDDLPLVRRNFSHLAPGQIVAVGASNVA